MSKFLSSRSSAGWSLSPSTNVRILLGIFLGLFSLLVLGVDGQIVAPSCNASLDFQWSFNTLDQSPCVVASYLGQACDAQYSIPSLNSSEPYSGPSLGAQANACQCSSVMYILLSACGACQGGSFITWSAYIQNCSSIYPTIFPENIPSGTKVPRWAYQNVTAEDDFNPTEAQAVGDAPESTGTAPPTGSTSVSTPTVTSSALNQGKKTNAGAIAGGVVGGVVVLLLAVAALLYLRRRQRHRKKRAAAANVIDDKPRPYPVGPVSSDTIDTGTGFHASIPTMSMPSAGMRLYNPSDPSTFPPTALSTSPSPPANHSPQSSETGVTGYFSSFHNIRPNRQPGLPEL
ncbi:hypothetical protein GGU10DRAFT_359575 [Lentinula aff. detonsa]|uniref:Uncharacterized protein n=1 Tax=Lentinula aff. detonsa TaxID=2804958 RepID=A0AA38KN98_9AGAR|nr:hypothetical protein GGU10DRAFT_359575 [Lentinula aff. detonsa]